MKRILLAAGVLVLLVACEDVGEQGGAVESTSTAWAATTEPATVTAAPTTPEPAPRETAPSADEPTSGSVPSSGLTVSEGALSLSVPRPIAALVEATQSPPGRALRMARLGDVDSAHVLYVLFSYGSAHPERPPEYDRRRVGLSRVSVRSNSSPSLDATVEVDGPYTELTPRFRRIEDIDGDGRPEVALSVRSADNSPRGDGQQTRRTQTFHDGDSLLMQFKVDRESSWEGHGYPETTRITVGMPDENDDGHPDMAMTSVHVVKLGSECPFGRNGYPEDGQRFEADEVFDIYDTESDCPYRVSRETRLYDPAADRWVASGER